MLENEEIVDNEPPEMAMDVEDNDVSPGLIIVIIIIITINYCYYNYLLFIITGYY